MKKYFPVLLVLVLCWGISFAQTSQTLTLDECVKIALKNNPTLKSAIFRYDIAKSQRLSSFSGILPYISTSASVTKGTTGQSRGVEQIQEVDSVTQEITLIRKPYTSPKQEWESYSFSVSFQQNLYDGGAWLNQIKQGGANKNAYHYGLLDQAANTVALVKQRYFELSSALDNLDVLNQAVKVAQEQLDRVKSMHEVGSAAKADVYRSQVQVGNEKINVITQERIILSAKNNLNIALGRDINEPIEIIRGINIDKNYNRSIDDVIQQVIENNYNLKSLEMGLKASRYGVGISKGSKYPSLGYSLSYSRSNADRDRVLTDKLNEDYTFSASIGLSYTIFNGFQRRTNIINSEKNYQITRENMINSKRQLLAQVKQFHNNIITNLDIIELSEANVMSAEEDLRLATEKYEVGSGTLLEVNTAQVNLRRARYNLVSAQYDLMTARANLDAMLGKLDEKYLEMIK